MKEGRKEMFYLMTHSTHFIYGYMASNIWSRTIQIVRKETRCRHIGYSFQLTTRFFYMHHPTDSIAHTTAFVTPVVEHWLEREIAQWVHPMKDRSDDHERTLLPRSYISLLILYEGWMHTKNHCCYGLCYSSRGLLVRTRNSSMGSPWGIDPITHRTLSRRCTMELHFAPFRCHYRKFTVATVRFTQNVSCNIYTHPIYQQVANVTV